MKFKPDFQSRFRILKGGKISLVVSALLGSVTLTFAAPTGGVVTSGNATISQNGTTTNINQSTQKATINWQNFSIKSNETVNFNQPNVNSITLNRVVGNERSVIDGALNANGQVWILNSNGILFNKNAKINTAGIVASTKNISDENFNAGNYTFSGNSTESVINMGTIEASDNGYVALLANSVQNDGTIKAYKGTVHLTGANEATINLNGNSIVSLSVNKGVLDALVENKGAILADGGKVYLTTNAVDELLKGVVNNTGIIEAKSLEDMNSEVILFAHGGSAQIGGTIKSENGFVETSGKYFDFLGANIQAREWLIDPVNITIDAGLASAIGTALNTGNVTITTDGNNNPSTASGQNGNDGDITVNSAITKASGAKTTLTLLAHRDITINGAISGSSGSALNVLLSARAFATDETTLGDIQINSNIKTYGGDITIGGGNATASGYAIASGSGNTGGIMIGSNAILDATGDGSGVANATLPTANSGGAITLRGKGNTVSNQANWGVQVKNGSIVTGGDGSIDITGYGGNGTNFWSVGSGGVVLETGAYIKSNTGSVTIKGYAGIGGDAYGIISTESSKLIGTNGQLLFDGDSLMIREGTLTINAGEDSDIKAPIAGCTGQGCGAFGLTKAGSGTLNLWGNSEAWNNARPANTASSSTNGTFTDATNSVNIVAITANQALYPFSSRPTTVNLVANSSAATIVPGGGNSDDNDIEDDVEVPSTPSTTTDNKIDKVIDTIVNQQQIKVEPPKILVTQPSIMTPIFAPKSTFVLPTVAPTTQATTMLSSISQALGLKQGESVSLISTPNQAEATQKVTMGEIQVLMGSNNGETNTQNNGNAPMVETRVALGDGSIIDLVNGGVNLPEDVDQEFYVVKTKQASN